MEPEFQSTSVEFTPEGQIRIHYIWRTKGLEMGGEFVFEAAKAEWLANCLIRAANDDLPTTDEVSPPDHLRVYIGGGHRYDDINVNVSNTREAQAPYGRLYVLSAMSREVARTLAEQLRACVGR